MNTPATADHGNRISNLVSTILPTTHAATAIASRALVLGALLGFAGTAPGAIFWNSTPDFASSGGVTGGASFGNDFTTQTFTPSGSLNFGSIHTADDLANITLRFNGMTVNGGGLETLKGRLDHSPSTGTDSRIGFQTQNPYVAGAVLKFSFSWANQMVSDKRNTPFAGPGADSFSNTDATFPAGGAGDPTPGATGWANLRHQLLWDTATLPPFSEVTWDLMGPNVGLATDDFYDGFTIFSPTANVVTTVNDDHARFTWTSFSDNNLWLNDTEDSAGSIDDFAVESFMVTVTLAEDLSAGSNFIFTLDGISNGVVPEPSGSFLGLLGLAILCFVRKRSS